MPFFFYIQRILLKTSIAISLLMLGFVLLTVSLGLRNVIQNKDTYFGIAFVLYIIYLLPLGRADKFDSVGNWDTSTIDPKIRDTMIAMSIEVKKRVYSPARSIPRIILILLQLTVLAYVIKTFLLPIIQ
ncbi:MAG: hypothetical protein JWP09_525 [Candidatus Taylorbacteria bacterium]|nr:hypothetical protein [Candidatus Taylorbacteria bacterium]